MFFLIISAFYQFANAQPSIKATIINMLPGKVHLAAVRGDRYTLLDSLEVRDGKMVFSIPGMAPAGVYRLILPRSKEQIFYNRPASQVDFIFNHEDIRFQTDFHALTDSMKVLQSTENKTYYSFLKREHQYQLKLELLDPVINYYPGDDPFLQEAKAKYNTLQKERDAYITNLCRDAMNRGSTFACKIINTYRSPFLDAYSSEQERMQYLRDHYFDHVDFSDTALLNSPAYTGLVVRYLGLYRHRRISPAEQEDAFIKAVDVIMDKAKENPVVENFILDYLIRGFEKFKMEKVLVYIADHCVDKDCRSGDESLQQKRMEAYKRMAVGRPAPEFTAEDLEGNRIDLYNLKNEYVLLVFWASWCPHCTKMMPELKQWYESRKKDVEVIAFSIDEDTAVWKESVHANGYDWINCNDPAGWDGEVALKYNIYATPTLFLLDQDRRIIAKPLSVEELNDYL